MLVFIVECIGDRTSKLYKLKVQNKTGFPRELLVDIYARYFWQFAESNMQSSNIRNVCHDFN